MACVRGQFRRGVAALVERLGWLLLCWLVCWPVGAATAADVRVRAPGIAVLESRQTEVDVWPVLSVLTEERPGWTLQDVLGLGGEHRMNVPGILGGNWAWRFKWDMLGQEPARVLGLISAASGRAPIGLLRLP